MKHAKQLLSLFVFLGFLVTHNVAQCGAKALHNLQELDAEIAQGKPTILMIHYSLCRHCITSMPSFDAATQAENNADIVFLKAETTQARDIKEKLNINATPTLVYYDKGKKIFQTSGAFNKPNAVTAPLRKYLKKGSMPSSQGKKPARKPARTSSLRQRLAAKRTLQ